MKVVKNEILIISFLFFPILYLVYKLGKIKNFKKELLILLTFLSGAVLMVYPRFSFFHLQVAFAMLAVLVGFLVKVLKVDVKIFVAYILFLFFLFDLPIIKLSWQKEARFYSTQDKGLADYIISKTSDSKNVYFLGLHSGLYVLSGKKPPKPWVDNYGWYFETPGFQAEVIRRWKTKPPSYIFWRNPQDGNWFDLGTYQPEVITEWIEKHYTKRERVEEDIWIWERM
jgi:hypothetical protein